MNNNQANRNLAAAANSQNLAAADNSQNLAAANNSQNLAAAEVYHSTPSKEGPVLDGPFRYSETPEKVSAAARRTGKPRNEHGLD